MLTEHVPTVAVSRPNDARVEWSVYLDGVVAVRLLKSGTVEVKTGDGDWREV